MTTVKFTRKVDKNKNTDPTLPFQTNTLIMFLINPGEVMH